MPRWITPNILTAIGLLGAAMIFASLSLGIENKQWLLLGIFGFLVNWFGDSLDGRLAYFRNIPRKWYGWALDINVDWIALSLIGLGFYCYLEQHKILAFLFVIGYGGTMIASLIRYKITDKYSIDAGLVGPTEIRVLLIMVLGIEMFMDQVVYYFALLVCPVLIILYLLEIRKVVQLGDEKDIAIKSGSTTS